MELLHLCDLYVCMCGQHGRLRRCWQFHCDSRFEKMLLVNTFVHLDISVHLDDHLTRYTRAAHRMETLHVTSHRLLQQWLSLIGSKARLVIVVHTRHVSCILSRWYTEPGIPLAPCTQ